MLCMLTIEGVNVKTEKQDKKRMVKVSLKDCREGKCEIDSVFPLAMGGCLL